MSQYESGLKESVKIDYEAQVLSTSNGLVFRAFDLKGNLANLTQIDEASFELKACSIRQKDNGLFSLLIGTGITVGTVNCSCCNYCGGHLMVHGIAGHVFNQDIQVSSNLELIDLRKSEELIVKLTAFHQQGVDFLRSLRVGDCIATLTVTKPH